MIRRGYADTAAGQVHFRRVDGPGTAVVLLHRTPASSACFEPMLRIMAGRRAAVALDTPGFGQSFAPAGSPTAADYARWLLAAIDALDNDQFHLCAHHTGTHFAVEIALLAGPRLQSLLLSGVLYAGHEQRQRMRSQIGNAPAVDADGKYLQDTWQVIRGLFPVFDAELVHSEVMGALASAKGRDQAFDAILSQDFSAALSRVHCPVRIVQALDDPLSPMLGAVRRDHPHLPIDYIGNAFLTAPERQPQAYTAALLAFADNPGDASHRGIPMTDRRFQYVRMQSGYALEQTAAPTPEPGPGEVLVRVRAVSLNRRDLSIRDLSYPVAPDANYFTPLSDAAGEVVAIGKDVSGVSVGDRVTSVFFPGWADGRPALSTLFSSLGAGGLGVFADHIVLPAAGVAAVPAGWSFEEAATLSCAGVTAWSALMRLGQLQAGDWALIIGTGGVAMYALQIAVAAGARVLVLSSSDEKLQRAKSLGAAAAINYNRIPEWPATVRELTGGGVQHVIELGGVGTLPKSIASAGFYGHIALIGALAGFGGDLSAAALTMSALRVSAVLVGSRADHLALKTFLEQHRIRPVIDSVFDADAAEAAYARAAGGAFGKVVIRMG